MPALREPEGIPNLERPWSIRTVLALLNDLA